MLPLLVLTACGSGSSPAEPWFVAAADIPTVFPSTSKRGKPSKKKVDSRGGEAVALLDLDGDDRLDIVVANGTEWLAVALNRGTTAAGLQLEHHKQFIGDPADGLSHRAKGISVHDLDHDGRLDLWLATQGKGGLVRYKRNPPEDKGLFRDAGFSSQLSGGDGSFRYQDFGVDGAGSKRAALFEDFDGDGHTDAWVSVSSYYGPWYAGGIETSQLYLGGSTGFGPDVIQVVVDGVPEGFWVDAQGRSVKNFKGAIVRDLDRDGRPDVIAGGIADLWANHELDVGEASQPGWQGRWDRGLFVFHNRSQPGAVGFTEVARQSLPGAWGHDGQAHVHSIIAIDVDHDGDLDLIASGNRGRMSHGTEAASSPVIRLLRNDSTPGRIVLVDATEGSGLEVLNGTSPPSPYPVSASAFGVQLTLHPSPMAAAPLDVDLDGHVDLVAVDRQTFTHDPVSGESYGLSAFVFRGDGRGGFTLVPPATHGMFGTARDLAAGDVDGDGRLDVVLVDGSTGGQFVSDGNRVWRNQLDTDHHWLGVTVAVPGDGFGIGTVITLRDEHGVVGVDEVRTDFSYRSRRDARVHLGVGDREVVDLTAVFRDGATAVFEAVPVDRTWRVLRVPLRSDDGGAWVRATGRVDVGSLGIVGTAADVDGDGRPDLRVAGPSQGRTDDVLWATVPVAGQVSGSSEGP